MSSTGPSEPRRPRNVHVALICAAGFFGMVGMAYASVPLYRAFCELTGFDGTARRAATAPGQALEQTLVVRFDANVRDLPWEFRADQTKQTVRIGETKLAFFKVTNRSRQAMTGRAVFNVVPEEAGRYFQKLDCFCFTDQTIQPGQTVEMPVLYFIDPKFASDFETKGEPEVTLSYTFFPSTNAQAAAPKADKKG
jgi:cytochrome c oxidase assembly protein subunit 11